MYAASGYDQYRTQAATTASPSQLVLMLFDGVLAEVARAGRALAPPVDVVDAHDCLGRAQAIVTELTLTLDHERGGQLATNLASLYAFCEERLVDANVRKSPEHLDDVTDVILGIREAWETACLPSSPISVAP